MNGHLSLSRDITEWGWYKDPCTFRVFFHLLMKANWKEGEYMGYKIGRGSLVAGRKQLALELDLSEQNVRTAINHLKSTNELTIKVTNKFSIITICKYERWIGNENNANQQSNQQSNQQVTSNQPTTNQQVTTIEERNKGIKEEGKKEKNPPFDETGFRREKEILLEEIASLRKQIEESKKEKKAKKEVLPEEKELRAKARDYFMQQYESVFQAKYYWEAKDNSNLPKLLDKIRYSRKEYNKPTDGGAMLKGFENFIQHAMKDPFTMKNFTIPFLNGQYNTIIGKNAQNSATSIDEKLKQIYATMSPKDEAAIYGIDEYFFCSLEESQKKYWRNEYKQNMLDYIRNHE